MTEREPRIEGRGLAVGKCTIRADQPSVVDLYYLIDILPGAGRGVRRVGFRSEGQDIVFPGRYRLAALSGDAEIELDVARAGAHAFALELHGAGRRVAQGYGLADPDDPRSLMISWWSGEVEPHGVVKYTIRDQRTIGGTYISKTSPDQPGTDIAVGNTRNGFSGQFVLSSREVNGRTWGPHDWSLRQQGDAVDLVWRENGKVFCLGLGMIDPADAKSVIVNYIAV
ncbi:hypothetical protein KRR38_06585 [Novosphingobium sp. G106]|uniref:hypothetical protein n=1 Tax=Novosphingobium sp. G106 TaxID=2849500 RepID=UPI001C2D500E|nr:hypothetical protein [Novosphingobium sp. G106]MBV1687350.1 hypothetical protein [Novosphingobium sp. G106]